ncbi:MAG TPA: sigma 54-interacting transcriptional regulator [Candidatus Binatia bacterium]|nr:sigma 54-interacting transcriptional regulator [Candidatus Binatia bacterium]
MDGRLRILVLDGEPPRPDLAAAARACPGADVRAAPAADAGRAVEDARPALVLVAGDAAAALDAVRALRARHADLPIVVVGVRDEAAPAVAAMQAGATLYVPARGDGGRAVVEACTLVTARAGERRPPRAAPPAAIASPLAGLVGDGPAMVEVRELVRTAARTEAHVLVEGETGTGKEVVARAIHALSRRASGPFVPVNCAAVPDTLAESEFFGHARGAFTGAVQERPGVLQLADRGTLFLDEVEDLSPALQAKLLRVVQDREVRPLGGTTLRRVDVRLVAASNRDLWRLVEAGTFRRDLYYRLRVLTIQLPPLRQRREDLPLLIGHFIARFNRQHGTSFTVPPPAALRPLLEHTWPGNVRELENSLESLLTLASASGVPLAALLDRQRVGAGLVADERTRIVQVLEEHRWNRQRAAAALGISRVTLWRRMERHGIRDPLGAPVGQAAS